MAAREEILGPWEKECAACLRKKVATMCEANNSTSTLVDNYNHP